MQLSLQDTQNRAILEESILLKHFGGNVIFSTPIHDKCPLLNEHLFHNYFVRIFVGISFASYEISCPCLLYNVHINNLYQNLFTLAAGVKNQLNLDNLIAI